ncbi:hypothetical protein J7J47_19155 [Halomonas sp. ISL-60]|uniref:hypothetical protein n=1 Tax=Halomonas sp. ISL-56 TaxID=2819149 RepID=UPI001BE926C0|nr:hypothetical protein [Halomonas sp. ISL-56]MBT2774348.1 hypothetical protein [Halomonas sp. ISL-60]MBT2799917.1 hypothetical protein [Halomonas sp. ISL-56]
MPITLLLTKKIASGSWISNDDETLVYWRWLPFRECIILTFLLSTLIVLFEIETIEIIIAIFSIGISSTSQLLRLSSASTTMGSLLHPLANEVLDTLDAIGSAGVGTVVVLFLLA